jgi:hypothetical protein
MTERCSTCDAEVELDEPQQCYYTGQRPCGDCQMNCFGPVICPDCENRAKRRATRLQRLQDMSATLEYREKRKEVLRGQYGGRYS